MRLSRLVDLEQFVLNKILCNMSVQSTYLSIQLPS